MKCPNCGGENPDGKVFCGDCGTTLRPPAPMPYPYALTPRRPPLKLTVNALCMVGAVLGVLSLFLPWALMVHQTSGVETSTGALEFMDSVEGEPQYSVNFRYAVTIFLIGTMMAFVTPLGGLAQVMGSVAFIAVSMTTSIENSEMIFWYGAAAALLASILVLTSIAAPIGFGYGPDRGFTLTRLLTWGVYR